MTGQKNLSVRLKSATITDNGGSGTYYAVDPSKSVITLSSSIGQVTVLLNRDRKNQTAQTSLQFTPEEINDQLIMLNFTQLSVNSNDTKVTVDGVQLNSTSQTMFLQSPSSSVITVTIDMTGGQQQVEPITLRWWLVSKRCSEKTVLRIGGQRTVAIARNPADVFKAPRQPPGTPLRCVAYLSTKTDARFAVHIFSPGGVADPADSVHFLDARGQAVVPGEQNNRLCNERTVLIDSNTAMILYESPYSSSLYTDYRAPEVWAIPKRGSLGCFLSGLLPFCVN